MLARVVDGNYLISLSERNVRTLMKMIEGKDPNPVLTRRQADLDNHIIRLEVESDEVHYGARPESMRGMTPFVERVLNG